MESDSVGSSRIIRGADGVSGIASPARAGAWAGQGEGWWRGATWRFAIAAHLARREEKSGGGFSVHLWRFLILEMAPWALYQTKLECK